MYKGFNAYFSNSGFIEVSIKKGGSATIPTPRSKHTNHGVLEKYTS